MSSETSAGNLVVPRDFDGMADSVIAAVVGLSVVTFALASLARLGPTDTNNSGLAWKVSLKGLLDRALPEGVRLLTGLWVLSTYLAGVIFAGLVPGGSWEIGDFRLEGRPDWNCGLK